MVPLFGTEGLGFSSGRECVPEQRERPWFTKQINHSALQEGAIRYSKGCRDD